MLLSSSTAVFAVAELPKHSVGKKQLKTAAVTTKKIHKGAVTSSKIAPKTVVSAQRMAFGKGFATRVPATTVLSLPRLHVTVTTDGDSDKDGGVVVHLPTLPSFSWFINSSDDDQMFSTHGGAQTIGSLPDGSAVREVTTHIWRADTSAGMYLHWVFDTTGFSEASRPLSCWAFSS